MATAYTAEIMFQGAAKVYAYHVTCSDVDKEFYINSVDGSSDFFFPERVVLKDVVFSTTAGTTNRVHLLLNGVESGVILGQNANQSTTVGRQVQQTPMAFNAGSKIRFQQRT